MKVKVGDTIYDAENEPVMIICTDSERKQMAQMPAKLTKYCQFPENMDKEEIKKWMELDAEID